MVAISCMMRSEDSLLLWRLESADSYAAALERAGRLLWASPDHIVVLESEGAATRIVVADVMTTELPTDDRPVWLFHDDGRSLSPVAANIPAAQAAERAKLYVCSMGHDAILVSIEPFRWTRVRRTGLLLATQRQGEAEHYTVWLPPVQEDTD